MEQPLPPVTQPAATPPTAASDPQNDVDFLLAYLLTHDAHCPLCKYNLRNLTLPRCPECGSEFALQVGIKYHNVRALITLLVALALSGGAGVVSLVMLLSSRGTMKREFAIYFVVYGSIISILPALVAVLSYRKIQRWPSNLQDVFAALAILWDVILLLCFLGMAVQF